MLNNIINIKKLFCWEFGVICLVNILAFYLIINEIVPQLNFICLIPTDMIMPILVMPVVLPILLKLSKNPLFKATIKGFFQSWKQPVFITFIMAISNYVVLTVEYYYEKQYLPVNAFYDTGKWLISHYTFYNFFCWLYLVFLVAIYQLFWGKNLKINGMINLFSIFPLLLMFFFFYFMSGN